MKCKPLLQQGRRVCSCTCNQYVCCDISEVAHCTITVCHTITTVHRPQRKVGSAVKNTSLWPHLHENLHSGTYRYARPLIPD